MGNNNLYRFAILCFGAVLIASCAGGYGPPYDASKFVSADTALDGRIGIFTLKRLEYRPATGWRAFPDGGIPKYVIDRNYVATYDFSSGRTRVIYREDALPRGLWLPGSSSLNIAATYGSRVILRTSGQLKSDYRLYKELSWLDLKTGKLSPLPLEEELAAQGRALELMYLVDGRGTLVLTVSRLKATGKIDKDSGKENLELLVRHPDGSYDVIGPFLYYYGIKEGEIHYWTPDNQYRAFNLLSKTDRTANRAGYRGLSSNPKEFLDIQQQLSVLYRDRYYLTLGRKVDGTWRYEELPFTVRNITGD